MATSEENIPIRFAGHDLMWLKNEDGSGALAPYEHLDKDGHVNAYDAFCSDSYAHVIDGKIWRYGECVGTVDDLEFLPMMA